MENAPVPPPLSFACPKQWESMRAAGRQRRFCDQCQLHVHDLSAMSATEAGHFLVGMSGRTCVSYRVRPSGAMVVCTRWNRLAKPLRVVRRGIFALLAMVAPMWFTGCASDKADGYRMGGSTIVDGKDSPPATTPRPDDHRLTGRIGHP